MIADDYRAIREEAVRLRDMPADDALISLLPRLDTAPARCEPSRDAAIARRWYMRRAREQSVRMAAR